MRRSVEIICYFGCRLRTWLGCTLRVSLSSRTLLLTPLGANANVPLGDDVASTSEHGYATQLDRQQGVRSKVLFLRVTVLIAAAACLHFGSGKAEAVEPYRIVSAVAERSPDGFVDVYVRMNRPLPREAKPEDEEVGRAILGTFVLARRSAFVSSVVTRVGLARNHCYSQTKEFRRTPVELKQYGRRVRLTFRFDDGRTSIVGVALVRRPNRDVVARLGCRS